MIWTALSRRHRRLRPPSRWRSSARRARPTCVATGRWCWPSPTGADGAGAWRWCWPHRVRRDRDDDEGLGQLGQAGPAPRRSPARPPRRARTACRAGCGCRARRRAAADSASRVVGLPRDERRCRPRGATVCPAAASASASRSASAARARRRRRSPGASSTSSAASAQAAWWLARKPGRSGRALGRASSSAFSGSASDAVAGRGGRELLDRGRRGRTGSRCPTGPHSHFWPERRSSRSRGADVDRHRAESLARRRAGRTPARASAATSTTWPLSHETCEQATSRVCVRTSRRDSVEGGDHADSTPRRRVRQPSGGQHAGVASLVGWSGPRRRAARSRPASAVFTPSVVASRPGPARALRSPPRRRYRLAPAAAASFWPAAARSAALRAATVPEPERREQRTAQVSVAAPAPGPDRARVELGVPLDGAGDCVERHDAHAPRRAARVPARAGPVGRGAPRRWSGPRRPAQVERGSAVLTPSVAEPVSATSRASQPISGRDPPAQRRASAMTRSKCACRRGPARARRAARVRRLHAAARDRAVGARVQVDARGRAPGTRARRRRPSARDSLGVDPSMAPAVIIERSMNDDFLSNAYLVGDEPGGHGVIIDSGGPPEPLLEAIEEHDLTVEHLLLTHHHGDHVRRTTSSRSSSASRSSPTRSRRSELDRRRPRRSSPARCSRSAA